VDADDFGLDADELASALAELGIETRRYYAPPVHEMRAYRTIKNSDRDLSVTKWASRSALSLPMWSELPVEVVESVIDAIHRIQHRAGAYRGPSRP
jgi:dTDP-4-amino-4,6-dideoxygalactose transaminase